MKRIFSMLLVCALVISLAGTALADEAVFAFSRDFFARMDGSTSMVPLGQAIASVLLGISREDAAAMISFNRTTQSFRNLANDMCDIVIAAEPKDEVFKDMRDAAFPYLMETIAKEALVFVVNENNPVNSLTTQQLRDIYSGEITNWKDVGGEDAPIEAFQRNATAGSQVMMEKLVMQGTPMMEAPITHIPGEMMGLIEAVKSYDNSANAIGYTVFYYASDMQMAQGLKILRVNDVLPSVQTIQSEEYPFLNGYYCCISANAAKDSPQRKLFQWLVSAEGQKLLAMEGYVPVSDGEGDPGAIFTDYSGYVPIGREPQKYVDFDCPHDYLEPSTSYGLIYPYNGPELFGSNEDWDWSAGQMQGFYNHEGQRITDPVYSSIVPVLSNDGDYFWRVSQGDLHGIAAKDGSAVTDICYRSVYNMGDLIMCERDYEEMSFDLYDRNLNLVKTNKDFPVGDDWMLPAEHQNGLFSGTVQIPGTLQFRNILMDDNGRVLMDTPDYISILDNFVRVFDDNWNVVVYDTDLNPLSFGEYTVLQSFYDLNENFYYAVTPEGKPLVIDRSGSLFEWDFENYTAYFDDGAFVLYRGKTMTVYDRNGKVMFDDLPKDWNYLGNKMFYQEEQDGMRLWKMPERDSLFIPGATWCYPAGDFIGCYNWDDEAYSVTLVNRDLQVCDSIPGDVNSITDPFTKEKYMLVYDSYGFSGDERLMTADMKTELLHTNGRIDIQNGFITVTDDWSFRSYAPDGTLIFCYPFLGMSTGD